MRFVACIAALVATVPAACGDDGSVDGNLAPDAGKDTPSQKPSCEEPKCVADVTQTCMPAGACVGSGNPWSAQGERGCWANGIHRIVQAFPSGSVRDETLHADGTTCYVVEGHAPGPGDPTIGYGSRTYRDGSGAIIATVDIDFDGWTATCEGAAAVKSDPCIWQNNLLRPAGCPRGTCM